MDRRSRYVFDSTTVIGHRASIDLKQCIGHVEAVFGGDITGQPSGAGGPDGVGPVEIVAELGQCFHDEQVVLRMACRLHSGCRPGIGFKIW